MAANSLKNQRGESILSKALGILKTKNKKSGNWYKETFPESYYKTYVSSPGKPVWMQRDYNKFAEEAYVKNVIAYRCISLIARSAANVSWNLFDETENNKVEIKKHPILDLLYEPNPCLSGADFFESIFSHKFISGNAYILAVRPDGGAPNELYILRPDRVSVIAGKGCIPVGYEYTVDKKVQYFPVNPITGQSNILHLKNFNPLNDYYGLSPIEAAAYSIDQHNQASTWNQSLLQNGAKPSGALTVKVADDGSGGVLTDEQFKRIKQQVDEQYTGAMNAGRPLLLEGGMEWKEMSLSPKDMDFINSKHSSARDIALAFGVPPQLLGIPGDNTYSNLVEARLALWEQTILPLLDNVSSALNNWLTPHFGEHLTIAYNTDKISALAPRRDMIWARIDNVDFMTINEKRQEIGLDPIEGGEVLDGK